MSYDTERVKLGREPISFVEMDMDFCTNTFGVSPCTATGEKCYNTKPTCKDLINYATGTPFTYRFSNAEGLMPDAGLAFPCVKRISYTPTKLSFGDGLAYRGKVTITMKDFAYHDGGIDPYLSSRTHDISQGTFWGKFLKRNKYYNGRPIRIKTGYYTEPFNWSNFETREYIIEQITTDARGNVTIQAKDILKKLDNKRVQIPTPSEGQLYADITSTATILFLNYGEGENYADSGVIRVEDEIMDYTKSDISYVVGHTFGANVTRTIITDGYNFVWTSPNDGLANEKIGFGIDPGYIGTGVNVSMKFTATINSGSLDITHYFDGTSYIALPNGTHTVVNGENIINMPVADSGLDFQTVSSDTVTDADIDFTNITIVQNDAFDLITRGAYGTVASEHSAEENVQVCKIYDGNAVDIIYDIITTYGGIDASYINSTAWATEKADWLDDKNFYTILSEPIGAQKLLEELTDQALTLLWWDDATQKIELKAIAPLEPTVTAPLLTDELNIIEDSLSVKDDVDKRFSQVWVYYGVRDWSQTSSEEDYASLMIRADLEKEGDDEYGDSRIKKIKSRWFVSNIQAEVYGTMYSIASKDAPKDVSLKVDAKDKLKVGDYVDVESRIIQDQFGASERKRYYVTESKDIGLDQFQLTLRTAWYDDDSWIYIAPDTAPDFASATDEEKTLYFYFTDDDGFNPDGTVGDKII